MTDRFLFLAHDAPHHVGGVSSWLGALLPRLRQRGMRPMAGVFLREDEGYLCHRLREDDIEIFTHSHHSPFIERARWTAELCRRTRTSVVVPNYLLSGFAAGAALRGSGVRTVAVIHSDDPYYRTLLRQQGEADPVMRFDHAVPVSRFLEKLARDELGDGFPITRIPCGPPEAAATATPPAEAGLRLVYTGRLVQEQKRIGEVVSALCRAVREIPGVSADIIGDGDDRDLARATAAAAGNPEGLRFVGPIDPEDVRRRLPGYHVQVLLSDYEGLPVSLVEGMMAGLVPVCTRMRSGIGELVTDGVSGLIVEDRGDGFIAAIRRLRENPGLWSELSSGAKAAAAPFSADRCADQWARLLESLNDPVARPALSERPLRMALPQWRPEFAWDMGPPPGLINRVRRAGSRARIRLGHYRQKLANFGR